MSLPTFFGPDMKLCDICGTRHEAYQGHVFASNAASNGSASNANAASNRPATDGAAIEPAKQTGSSELGVVGDAVARDGVGVEKPAAKQRWSRESYNRYQRDYMRARRARVPS